MILYNNTIFTITS